MKDENDINSVLQDAQNITEELKDRTTKEINTEEDLATTFAAEGETKENSLEKARHIWLSTWKGIHYYSLPNWMQDNDFLHRSHRPQLPSFAVCFKSIFRLHSETGNIWSHLLGCLTFLIIAFYSLTRPEREVEWENKIAFLPFFIGAIGCMGLSFVFHTVYCHSESVNKFFLKLDYVGISLLTIGSFIPWCYYAFYCHPKTRILYLVMLSLMSIICIYISLFDEFMTVAFRPYRVGLFICFGYSALIPSIHLIYLLGFQTVFYEYSLNWMLLMGFIYVAGGLMYAFRVPERFFPGQCDIWFHSHQVLHLCVVLAAFVHYHGISSLVERKMAKHCEDHCTIKLE